MSLWLLHLPKGTPHSCYYIKQTILYITHEKKNVQAHIAVGVSNLKSSFFYKSTSTHEHEHFVSVPQMFV
jgi:hypothetical protein